jgi:hypothetical protein
MKKKGLALFMDFDFDLGTMNFRQQNINGKDCHVNTRVSQGVCLPRFSTHKPNRTESNYEN